jgi:hypothetical protein
VAAATGKKEAKVQSEAVLPFITAAPVTVAVAQAAPAERQIRADYRDDDQPAYSRRDGHGNDDRGDDDRYSRDDGDDNRRYAEAFSDDDRRIIRSCYSEDYSNLPPGLAKRGGNLPPGLERQLQRNGKLPPGLQKRVRPLPTSMRLAHCTAANLQMAQSFNKRFALNRASAGCIFRISTVLEGFLVAETYVRHASVRSELVLRYLAIRHDEVFNAYISQVANRWGPVVGGTRCHHFGAAS